MVRYKIPKMFSIFLITVVVQFSLLHNDAKAQASNSLNSNVSVGNVTATAGNGGTASNSIGSTPDGSRNGHVSVYTGDVTTTSRGGKATTRIGSPGGTTNITGSITNQDGNVSIQGDANVNGEVIVTPGSNLNMGGCGSVSVNGDVVIAGGSLEVGCACAGIRDGVCCIQFYDSLCVVNQVPPGKHGCPPQYQFRGGLCRLFKDFSMSYGR